MQNKLYLKPIISISLLSLLTACGGGESTNSNPEPNNNGSNNNTYLTQQTVEDPTTQMARNLNTDDILAQANNVNADNYVAFYKRITDLKAFGVPDLKASFRLNERANRSALQLDTQQRASARRIDKTYNCLVSGSASEVVNLIPRDTLTADTFKTGDDYKIIYHNCNMGNTTYRGSKTHHVNDFSEFDFSKVGAGDPLGKFTTTYNNYSIETSTQKITLDGTFIYNGKATYPAVQNAAPTSLTKSFSAKAGSSITILNNETNSQTTLTYDGILEETIFSKKLLTENEFTYCKKSHYKLNISENSQSTKIPIYSLFCGDVESGASDTLYPPRSLGQLDQVGSTLNVNGRRIITFVLADGRTRYLYQANSSSNTSTQNPDSITESDHVIYNLPETDNVDLMKGVVVFAYDGCPGYNGVFNYLNDNNIPHTYVNIRNTTTANLAAFNWFGANFVPYVGVNGHFFGGPAIKTMLTLEGVTD